MLSVFLFHDGFYEGHCSEFLLLHFSLYHFCWRHCVPLSPRTPLFLENRRPGSLICFFLVFMSRHTTADAFLFCSLLHFAIWLKLLIPYLMAPYAFAISGLWSPFKTPTSHRYNSHFPYRVSKTALLQPCFLLLLYRSQFPPQAFY